MQMSVSNPAASKRSTDFHLPAPEEPDWPKPIPLSFAQQRLWFLDRLEPNTPVYNVPLGLRWVGRLEVRFLQAALNELVRRHEALRTNFVEAQGAPAQVIRKTEPVPLPIVDLSS